MQIPSIIEYRNECHYKVSYVAFNSETLFTELTFTAFNSEKLFTGQLTHEETTLYHKMAAKRHY